MKIELNYIENIKALMSWKEEIYTFSYYFNEALNLGLEYKPNNNTTYLSNNYYEHLISTFLVTYSYNRELDPQNKFRYPEASFLCLLYFYVFQEKHLNYYYKDVHDLFVEELERLESKKLINKTTKLKAINISLCLVSRDTRFDTSEHIDARLILDIIYCTSPVLIKTEESVSGIVIFFSELSDLKFIVRDSASFSNHLIIMNFYRIEKDIVNGFVRNYFNTKINKLLELKAEIHVK